MSRLVIVSNRVPVPGDRNPAAGGLAVALADAVTPGSLWFGWSGGRAALTKIQVLCHRRYPGLGNAGLPKQSHHVDRQILDMPIGKHAKDAVVRKPQLVT